MFNTWSRKKKWGGAIGLFVVLVIAMIVLVVFLTREDSSTSSSSSNSTSSNYTGAVATDSSPCEQIGRDLILAGGNGIDVALGVLFCEGVASAQSMGLGGGFLMTIYDRVNKTAYVLDSRETAPLAANSTMYGHNETLALRTALGFAVPAELAGYWAAYQKFGSLPWADLIAPTIKLCEEGIVISSYLASMMEENEADILAATTLKDILLNENGTMKKAGEIIKRPLLAKTLRVIAEEGKNALYNGSLTTAFLQDLKDFGSIITKEDLQNYEPRWETPTHAWLPGGLQMYSVQPPGSGPVVAHFLQITGDYVQSSLDAHQYHRIVEAMKFAYAERTKLGDLAYEPGAIPVCEQMVNQTYANEIRSKIMENATSLDPAYYGANVSAQVGKGTAHIAVVTPHYAVSVTSTINTIYGSLKRSLSTGIIINNEMDDFSMPGVNSSSGLPPSPANFIQPGKRPLSSMAPSIFLDSEGEVILVLGASGGLKITSAICQIALKNLYLEKGLVESIQDKRIHHQLLPMTVMLEYGFSEELAAALKKFGHPEKWMSTTASAAMGIRVNGTQYHPVADLRREGVSVVV